MTYSASCRLLPLEPQFHVDTIRVVDIHGGAAMPFHRPPENFNIGLAQVCHEIIDRSGIHDQAEMVHTYWILLIGCDKIGTVKHIDLLATGLYDCRPSSLGIGARRAQQLQPKHLMIKVQGLVHVGHLEGEMIQSLRAYHNRISLVKGAITPSVA